jgi:hypothetical protein
MKRSSSVIPNECEESALNQMIEKQISRYARNDGCCGLLQLPLGYYICRAMIECIAGTRTRVIHSNK